MNAQFDEILLNNKRDELQKSSVESPISRHKFRTVVKTMEDMRKKEEELEDIIIRVMEIIKDIP